MYLLVVYQMHLIKLLCLFLCAVVICRENQEFKNIKRYNEISLSFQLRYPPWFPNDRHFGRKSCFAGCC